MSKLKTKELIICIVTVAILVLTIVTDVFAIDDIAALAGNNTNNSFENIQRDPNFNTNTNTNTNINVNTNTNTNINTNTNVNANKNSNVNSIPDTGVDYSVLSIIAICGVFAVYAYKKIKDYNNF